MLDPRTNLVARLGPVLEWLLARLRERALANTEAEARALERALEQAFPRSGEVVQAIAGAIDRDLTALCDRGRPPVRFGRVAKPGPETHGFSVDIVELAGPALAHGHPRGEITLGFERDREGAEPPRFDGRAPGWICMPAGSRHTPTVTGGTMALLYCLPDGAIAWGEPAS